MRIAFVGASKITIMTARYILEHKHEVIIVENDKNLIDQLSSELDCGFLHGDGSTPELLRELAPEQTDFLFCLTENDQTNIIASLVGRSLGFKTVITKIENQEFEHICTELGLEHTIIPTRTISRFLIDMLSGKDILELSTMIKDEARFFSFIARDEDEQELSELQLPETAQVICYYREGKFILADKTTRLKKGDEVVILTHSKNLASLRERWT
jgi:trk system potassium uptake protein TrkA